MGALPDYKMGCEIQKPLCRCTFAYAVIFLMLTLIWFGFCAGGMDKLPKCRYGENDCFWHPSAAVCFFFDRCFSNGSTKALETAKWFAVASLCLWMFSLHIVQNLTFNGRWWNQSTQDDMKSGYGMFCVGAIGNIF